MAKAIASIDLINILHDQSVLKGALQINYRTDQGAFGSEEIPLTDLAGVSTPSGVVTQVKNKMITFYQNKHAETIVASDCFVFGAPQ